MVKNDERGSAQRASVAVRNAIARIESHDPGAGRLLRDCIRTGAACRYNPNPDHPAEWVTA